MRVDARKLTEAMSAIEALIKQEPRHGSSAFLEGPGAGGARSIHGGDASLQRGRSASIPARSRRVSTLRDSSSSAASRQPLEQSRTRSSNLRPATPRPVSRSSRRIAHRGSGRPPIEQIADLARAYPDWIPVHIEASRLAIAQSNWSAARNALDRMEALDPDSQGSL